MSLKLSIKNIVATAFFKFGLFKVFNSKKNNAFVLMYHRVLDANVNSPLYVQPGMFVSAASFRQHIAYLKTKFTILSLGELVARCDAGKTMSGCCAITFDDGWLDNFTVAFPILQELQIPATIFLATGAIGTDRLFWPEELSFYLSELDGLEVLESNKRYFDLQSIMKQQSKNREQLLDEAISTVKAWQIEQRTEFLECLRTACSGESLGRILMNWDEVRRMQASGLIDFGAHTANHVILDQVSLSQVECEVAQSRHDIENNLAVTPSFFAYPNGNYNSDIQAIVKRCGFRGAFTTRKGWFDSKSQLFEIPRIGLHEDVSRTIPLLLSRMYLRRF